VVTVPLPSREAASADDARHLARVEYEDLAEMGVFGDFRVELLYGRVATMSPQGDQHIYSVQRLMELLLPVLLGRARVRVQVPVAASDDSEPEPDVAVVPHADYLDGRPQHCHLVVEVSDTSRTKDLGLKARLYAEMGVPDYWVVDLAKNVIVVHRAPADGRYDDVRPAGRGAEIALLAFPDVMVRVDDVLPPPR
jgi:Uma2 family endonuclease